MNTQGENIQSVIQLCVELISAPSISGEELKAVQVLKRYYRSRGINELYVDEYGSLVAIIRGNRAGQTILLMGILMLSLLLILRLGLLILLSEQ